MILSSVLQILRRKSSGRWIGDEFTQTPSRLSAPQDVRAERQALLDAASQRDIITDYSGVRISKSGRLFEINDVVLWNVYEGDFAIGQAAKFDRGRVRFLG